MGQTTITGLPAASLPLPADAAIMGDITGSGPTSKFAKSDLITPVCRTLTVSGTTCQLLASDNVVRINNTGGHTIAILAAVPPGINQTCQIKDISGTASQAIPITFAGTVDGELNPSLISSPFGFSTIRFNQDGSVDRCG